MMMMMMMMMDDPLHVPRHALSCVTPVQGEKAGSSPAPPQIYRIYRGDVHRRAVCTANAGWRRDSCANGWKHNPNSVR